MNESPNVTTKLPTIKNREFKESEINYKLLVDSVKDYAIFMLDAEGYIISWNAGAEALKGYKREEILYKHFSIFYTEEALNRDHPAFELATAKKVGRFEEEGWRIKKDGSTFWANVVITALFNDEKELVGFAKVTKDLTERKKLEDKLSAANEELKESEERSRLLIAGVKDYAIFLLTPEGNIATWNTGAKRIKGYEADEVIGKNFSMFYTSEARAAKFPQFELAKALEDGRFEDEGWRLKKDGTKFWANAILTPIFNSKKEHIGYTKITRDLSERVRNEGLMKKNTELHRINTDLDNFIYTASHDLKSPISNLEGLLLILKRKINSKLDESGKQIVEMMGVAIHKLNNTIENLVEVTKAQKNLEDELEVISVKGVLDDIKEELTLKIAKSETKIVEVLDVEEIPFSKGSLRSVIYNLLSNAIKYRSPKRIPEIKISTYHQNGKIVLSVKDNGLGLKKHQEEKLFSMFKRFHSHVEGSGVGLYIVKRTMENYGGRVEVNSKFDEGTEFKLYFKS